jgi:predicted nuclease with TOPRIM domain
VITFPLLRRLKLSGYGLYPGPRQDGIIDLEMGSGPWLILGVNGLGKSTLLLLMRYLLAGAVRPRDAGFAGEREDIQPVNNRLFAARVGDDARDATGTLEVAFGDQTLTVARRLSNLSLASAELLGPGGQVATLADEGSYRATLAGLMGLEQFADALRTLDHVVFYLEARQPLIWEGQAQFEIFRALLTPDTSAELRRLEGEIISADSSARNLNAIVTRMIKTREKELGKLRSQDATRARLASLQASLHEARASEEVLRQELDEVEEERDAARLLLKRAEKSVDDAAQTYERLKFDTLRSAFAGVPPTEQYLFLKLISDRVCLACNQQAEQAAVQTERRLAKGLCVVCGSPHGGEASTDLPEDWRKTAEQAFARLEAARSVQIETQKTYNDRAGRALQTSDRLDTVRRSADSFLIQISKLAKDLPVGDVARLDQEQSRITAMAEQVKDFVGERSKAEAKIESLLAALKAEAERFSDQLQTRFNDIARPFFAERVQLVYAPRETRIGQAGKVFSFPAFEVEMTSGATAEQFIRRKAEQVSLSQREYLDLIFRMVLLDVFGRGGGSLVVDGPEGSVDAVFAERAGDLFAGFAAQQGANAILACNIVEGGFIPHTLGAYPRADARSRVVNLLEQAAPTAALRKLRPEYEAKVDAILGRAP